MAHQPDDNNSSSDEGPKVQFDRVLWPSPASPVIGPVANPGPLPMDQDILTMLEPHSLIDDHRPVPGGDDEDGVMKPTQQTGAVQPVVSSEPVRQVAAVDATVLSELIQMKRTLSTMTEAIANGRVRDSLDLAKNRAAKPHLGRGLSQSSSQISPFNKGDAENPARPKHSFSLPMTLSRSQPSHALNIVQPKPSLCKSRRTPTAPVERMRLYDEPLRKYNSEPPLSTYTGGDLLLTSEAPRQEPHDEEVKAVDGKASKVARKVSLVLGCFMPGDESEDEGAVSGQPGGIIKKGKKLTAKEKGKGKAVGFVVPGEPLLGEDLPMEEEAGPSQARPSHAGPSQAGPSQAGPSKVAAFTEQQDIMMEGKAKAEEVEVADAGPSALHQDNHAGTEPQVGGTLARNGKQVQLALKAIRRKVRKTFGRPLKVPAFLK